MSTQSSATPPAGGSRSFAIGPEEAGQRLDRYLVQALRDMSRSAVQQLIAKHAQQETGTYATQLDETAKNPMLWPDQALLSQVSLGRNLTTDEESKAWHDTFDPIWEQ